MSPCITNVVTAFVVVVYDIASGMERKQSAPAAENENELPSVRPCAVVDADTTAPGVAMTADVKMVLVVAEVSAVEPGDAAKIIVVPADE